MIFRYDEVRRRVRAAGAYGIGLEPFADAHVTVEYGPGRAPGARGGPRDRGHPRHPERDPGASTASWCARRPGVHADGRRRPLVRRDPRPTAGARPAVRRRALPAVDARQDRGARHAPASRPCSGARARQLQERIDLARDVHEGVIQRLFGVQLVFSSVAELPPEARQRIAAELQAALVDLRRALQRPLGRIAPETQTTLLAEVARLRREHPDLHLELGPGSERVRCPRRSSRSRSPCSPRRCATRTSTRSRPRSRSRWTRQDDALFLDVCNDGVARPRATDGHGAEAGRARGAAGRRDRGVRRARARDVARAAGGAGVSAPDVNPAGCRAAPDRAPAARARRRRPRGRALGPAADARRAALGRALPERAQHRGGAGDDPRYEPHVALVDLFVGQESGAEICERLRERSRRRRC